MAAFTAVSSERVVRSWVVSPTWRLQADGLRRRGLSALRRPPATEGLRSGRAGAPEACMKRRGGLACAEYGRPFWGHYAGALPRPARREIRQPAGTSLPRVATKPSEPKSCWDIPDRQRTRRHIRPNGSVAWFDPDISQPVRTGSPTVNPRKYFANSAP